MAIWQPDSWQQKESSTQLVNYDNPQHLQQTLQQLSVLPPLVSAFEIEKLKTYLAEAGEGKRFILQGGDCAESFADCNGETLTNKLKILLQMSLVLLHGLRIPITRIGRIAGQYAKPRSKTTESQDGIELPSFRGDIVNQPEFTLEGRKPNPERMLQAYHYAAITLNYIRAMFESGFADLGHPEFWNLDFLQHSPMAKSYQAIADRITDALGFCQAIPGFSTNADVHRVDFFTSHEALHLYFEQALTRQEQGKWYNLSTHFPWIGMRTASPQSAHMEYMRGIDNPIGVKVGPTATIESILETINILNPNNRPGRLSLIHRFGTKEITKGLPPIIEAVQKAKKNITWICDPMHGNTETTQNGIKTRQFGNILSELKQAFNIHQELQSHLGGVHFEMTGENVTECLGGARGLTESDLERAYKSLVDPRLNYEQALEMAMCIVSQD